MLRFDALLIRPEGAGTWTYLDLPPEVTLALGTRREAKVRGTLDGVEFRTSALPKGAGRHYLVVNQALREALGKSAGDWVAVEIAADDQPRSLELPAELALALEGDPTARAAFDALPPSHRKEYVAYIAEAKKPETRLRRVETTLARLKGLIA